MFYFPIWLIISELEDPLLGRIAGSRFSYLLMSHAVCFFKPPEIIFPFTPF